MADNTGMWVLAGVLASFGVYMYIQKNSAEARAAEMASPVVTKIPTSGELERRSPISPMNITCPTGYRSVPAYQQEVEIVATNSIPPSIHETPTGRYVLTKGACTHASINETLNCKFGSFATYLVTDATGVPHIATPVCLEENKIVGYVPPVPDVTYVVSSSTTANPSPVGVNILGAPVPVQ